MFFRPQTGANSNRAPSPKADYMFWFHSATHLRIWILDNATHPGLRPPLSERGEGTASGRSDSEAVNENEVRGVSHHQTSSIQGVSHCQIGYPLNPVYPWFTYRGRLAQNLKESIQKRSNLFCPLLFVLASQRAPDAAFGAIKKCGQYIAHTLSCYLSKLLCLGFFDGRSLSDRSFGHGSLCYRSFSAFCLLTTATTASALGFLSLGLFQHILVVVNELDDGHL